MRLRIRITSINSDGTTNSEIKELKKDSCTVGRVGADLTIDNGGASRRHAMFYQGLRGELRVMDLHSTNGTFLGEDKIIDHPIGVGTIIRVANSAITVLDFEPDRNSFGANLPGNLDKANDRTAVVTIFKARNTDSMPAEGTRGGAVSSRTISQLHPNRKVG